MEQKRLACRGEVDACLVCSFEDVTFHVSPCFFYDGLIVLRAASEERLQEKLREVRRRLVACLPVGASAKEKTESLRDSVHDNMGVDGDWFGPV